MDINPNQVHATYRQFYPILVERFPIAFNRDNPLPLEVGVFEKLITIPDLGMCDDELECVLLCWTARREYCRAAALGDGWRYDVLGQRVAQISSEDMERYQFRYNRFVRQGSL